MSTGASDVSPGSFLEFAKGAGLDFATAANASGAANSLGEATSGAEPVCTLLPGLFGISIQVILCVTSVGILFLKYMYEVPKRPPKVFIQDFIQLMCGSSTVHILNIVSSILINKISSGSPSKFAQDECNMYFMTTLFDATVGVYIEYKIVRHLAIRRAALNYLLMTRKSKFKPTLKELEEATRLATLAMSKSSSFLLEIESQKRVNANELNAQGLSLMTGNATNLLVRSGSSSVTGFGFGSDKIANGTIAHFDESVDGLQGDNDDLGLENGGVDDYDALLKNTSHGVWRHLLNIATSPSKWIQRRENSEFVNNLTTWLIIVCGLKLATIVFFYVSSCWINAIAAVALCAFDGKHRLKLFFVMIGAPLVFNVFQYYITDAIIKIKAPTILV